MKSFPLIFFSFYLMLTGMPVHLFAGQVMPIESDTLKLYDQFLGRELPYSIGEPVLIQVFTPNPHFNSTSGDQREFIFRKVQGKLNNILGDSIKVYNEWFPIDDIGKITKPGQGGYEQVRVRKVLSALGLLIAGPSTIVLGIIVGFSASGFILFSAWAIILLGLCGLLGIIPYLASTPGVRIGKRFRLKT